MQRGESGRYEVTSIGGEHVRAFVPAPLPPKPNLVLDGSLQQILESAVLALGRLDGVADPPAGRGTFFVCIRAQRSSAFFSDRGHTIIVVRPLAF